MSDADFLNMANGLMWLAIIVVGLAVGLLTKNGIVGAGAGIASGVVLRIALVAGWNRRRR